jgi:hypothetical protein
MKLRAICSIVALLAPLAIACSAPDTAARVDPVGPDATTFPPVSLVLSRRCGSIDCHGSRYRNLRIYGYGGLRLRVDDRPDTPTTTTPEEAQATYDAVIALEPELMRDIVLAKGSGADRLTLVRKGRADEDHKGGKLIMRGDDADTCLMGWLRGVAVDDAYRAACTNAAKGP